MPPRELILGISKGRMDKLKGGSFGHTTIPVKLRGAGGEVIGGMLSVAGSQHGGMLQATGAGNDWMKVAKKVAGVAGPLSMLAGPEMAPVAGALAACAGSGKKRRKATARKAKKTTGVAGEIAKILLDTQGYAKEGEAIAQVGRVVAGSGKKSKSKKIKNTIGDVSQIAALLGQTSGYMTPQQAAATQAIGSLIQGSGPSDLTGDVFYPPEAVLPPRPRNARPRVAVGGGAPVPKKRFAVQ